MLAADRPTREALVIGITPLRYPMVQEAKTFGAAPTAVPGARRVITAGPTTRGCRPAAERAAGGLREIDSSRTQGTGGATLGPVRGTIVGEVFLGLFDDHRQASGRGIDLNPSFTDETPAHGSPAVAEGDLPAITETVHDAGGESFGRRYLLRNFLHDAGVSVPVAEGDVCPGVATPRNEGC